MSPLRDDDLPPNTGAAERAALEDMADRLTHERPAPRAAIRAQLRADLGDRAGRRPQRTRPAWLWPRVATLTICGGALLGVLGAGLAGSGPFTP